MGSAQSPTAPRRGAMGIALILFGLPIVVYIRDEIGLAPGSFGFTGTMLVCFSLFLLPTGRRVHFTLPSGPLGLFALAFILLAITRMIGTSTETVGKDTLYFGFLFLYATLLLLTSNEKVNGLHRATLLVVTAGNVLYLFAALNIDMSVVARRYLGDTLNPNFSAFAATYGIAAAAVSFADDLPWWRLLASACLLSGLAVIGFSGTRTALLIVCLVLAVSLARLVRRPMASASVGAAWWVMVAGVAILTVVVVAERVDPFLSTRFYEGIPNTWHSIVDRTGDESSMERMEGFDLVWDVFARTPGELVRGRGYKYRHLDVPVLQAALDLGIIGGVLFAALICMAVRLGLIYSTNPGYKEPELTFLGLMTLPIAVLAFSHGQPYDVSLWLPLATVVCFLGRAQVVRRAPPTHISSVSPDATSVRAPTGRGL